MTTATNSRSALAADRLMPGTMERSESGAVSGPIVMDVTWHEVLLLLMTERMSDAPHLVARCAAEETDRNKLTPNSAGAKPMPRSVDFSDRMKCSPCRRVYGVNNQPGRSDG
jgi:hypothetical protein